MVRNIITDLCHHLEIGIDGNLDIGNKRVIVGTPTITLIGNTFTISCSTSNVNIYYTLDGSTPTSNSIRYISAVTLSNNCTIKAIAIKGNKYSAIVEETYVKPITYLTQWKIVGNSEVHGNEIWSCGEYNATDGKYHILVQPLGGSIADIALDAPLRKVNDVADSIEFPSENEGKALVTRNLKSYTQNPLQASYISGDNKTCAIKVIGGTPIKDVSGLEPNLMCDSLEVKKYLSNASATGTFMSQFSVAILVRNSYIEQTKEAYQDWLDTLGEVTFIYQLGTPTTELVDTPQIEEADSYTCVISQGGKAVEWSSFTPNPT